VFLAVLLSPVASQEHLPEQNAMDFGACLDGRSATQAIPEMFY
jgi:hypothetical protein